MSELLTCRGLTKRYGGIVALKRVDLTLERLEELYDVDTE